MWRSWSLRTWSLVVLVTINCGIIAVVAVLLALSIKHNGFVSIRDQNSTTSGSGLQRLLQQGLLWTTLPSVLLTLYRIYLESVVTALINEVPYAELYSDNGSSIRKSLMLDYRTYPSLYAWYFAFRNGHWLHGSGMLLRWVVSLYIIPFSAYLMTPGPADHNEDISVRLTKAFNASSINASVSYGTVLDTVSATRIYGADLPPWTDGVFAFPAVDLSNVSDASNVIGLGLNVDAYSAYVDCRALTDYSVTRLDAGADIATITFSAADRGCDITIKGGVSGSSTTYLKTNAKTNCPQDAGYSRLYMFAGSYSPDEPYLLSNISFISCIPFYRKTPGYLNITRAVSSSPMLAFDPDAENTRDARFDTWTSFEYNLQNVQQINAASADFTSTLGEVILSYSRTFWPDDWISAEHLQSSVSVVFSTTFAVLAATVAYQPTPTATITAATLTSVETRLQVVTWIAYSFFVLFTILIGQVILTFMHTRVHPTFLQEEPKGLMSSAEIVTNSPALQHLILQAQENPTYEGKICEYAEKRYDIDKTKCWVTRHAADKNSVLLGTVQMK